MVNDIIKFCLYQQTRSISKVTRHLKFIQNSNVILSRIVVLLKKWSSNIRRRKIEKCSLKQKTTLVQVPSFSRYCDFFVLSGNSPFWAVFVVVCTNLCYTIQSLTTNNRFSLCSLCLWLFRYWINVKTSRSTQNQHNVKHDDW